MSEKNIKKEKSYDENRETTRHIMSRYVQLKLRDLQLTSDCSVP